MRRVAMTYHFKAPMNCANLRVAERRPLTGRVAIAGRRSDREATAADLRNTFRPKLGEAALGG